MELVQILGLTHVEGKGRKWNRGMGEVRLKRKLTGSTDDGMSLQSYFLLGQGRQPLNLGIDYSLAVVCLRKKM